MAAARIPEACQGFPLAGLRYSPGGAVLPNRCEPFHPTWNNPYAIRCIDAIPEYDSGFPGDEYCILPPPPDKGVQVGMHPQGQTEQYWEQMLAGDMSGYASPGPEWILEPGTERTSNYRTRTENQAPQAYYRIYFRLRTGGHHTILTLHDDDEPLGWSESLGGLPGFATELLTLLGNIGGQQRPDDNVPVTLEKPSGDEGLYFEWPHSPSVLINFHGINTQQEPLLNETWVNVWWEEDTRVLAGWFLGYELGQIVNLQIQPGEIRDLHYVFDLVDGARVLSLLGHRHAWTTNFSAWIERRSGEIEPLYQSFDWSDIPTYRFDSAKRNPEIATENRTDGAASGVIEVAAGDRLHFNCHIEYTDERAAAVNAPQLPAAAGPLYFENEVFGGEMCVLFGVTTDDPFAGLPTIDPEPPPDFARAY